MFLHRPIYHLMLSEYRSRLAAQSVDFRLSKLQHLNEKSRCHLMVHLSCTFSMHGNVQKVNLGSGGGLSDPVLVAVYLKGQCTATRHLTDTC